MATIYCTPTSLDGFIADEHESLSWLFSTPGHADDPHGWYGDDVTLDFDRFIEQVETRHRARASSSSGATSRIFTRS